ncbi:MAG: hypothetical protein R3F11_03750 [Verrucomicrobiales bacterium]
MQQALARLERANLAVPVALDFSMAQLYRARVRPDPAKREAMLKDAEKTLLAIKVKAGDSQRYINPPRPSPLLAGQARRRRGDDQGAAR